MTTSSCSVGRLSAAMSSGRIDFVSSGLRLCSSANLVFGVRVYGKSVVLAILTAFLSRAVVMAGAKMSFADSSN